MVKKSPKSGSPVREHVEDAPVGWKETQEVLAAGTGLSLLLVDGRQPPAIAVSNNNSICEAFQSSPDYVKFCDPYCGDAHQRAMSAGTMVEYKCHAGLQCFTQPVKIGSQRNLAVIGGRAFVKSSDYQTLVERLRTGDLQELGSPELFTNIVFADAERLHDLSERVNRAASRVKAESSNGSQLAEHEPSVPPERQAELELEVARLKNELEYRSRFADSLQHFLERISSDDPAKTYESILANSKELLKSERASLMVFDESAKQLIVKAAVGFADDPATVGPLSMGESVSGGVLESGRAMMVKDLEAEGRTPAVAERLYKTKSFISYPIAIGNRKIGVLNVTDKAGGGAYDEVDLSLLDIIGPQVALALERAEWQERATEFQLMSITDPLTSLPNRRYLEERLTEEMSRSKRYQYPMSFLMIDIDDFKSYNDNNGHPAGDLALQITAHCLKAALRSADVASRYGGEEFCILLPQTSIDEAGAIAERIRHRIATTHYPHGKSQPLGRVSISIGVSTFSPIVNTPETIVAAADRALYEAKRQGKDRMVFYRD
ncbi:MAG TPA: diguanylate cyclase [Pyrinomonadaceae bacterium]|nr:diguanylate cyclase [Pyrinomonadaceae bacterium]